MLHRCVNEQANLEETSTIVGKLETSRQLSVGVKLCCIYCMGMTRWTALELDLYSIHRYLPVDVSIDILHFYIVQHGIIFFFIGY